MATGNQAGGNAGHFKIPGVGILIERKTDILAASAFVLAIASAGVQITFFLAGASISVVHPEQVLLNFDRIHGYSRVEYILRIAARMAYVNTGRPNYNATLSGESVSFTLHGREFVQYWHSEQQFSDPEEDGVLNKKFISIAGPKPIHGGSSLSRQVYFSPLPVRCRTDQPHCDSNANFLPEQEAFAFLADSAKVTFKFESYVFEEEEPESVSCTIDVTETLLRELMIFGWSAPFCWPQDEHRHTSSPTPADCQYP